MNTILIIMVMIFLHIVADYNLQGWLASAKQKSYWKEHAPNELYKNDYIMALFMHSFQWTFMIMLPILFLLNFEIGADFILWFVFNVGLHMYVDHLKANMKIINLVEDQLLHILQIVITAGIFIF